jgi:hypothetical protein
MMPRLLIPTGRWKVDAESANEQSTIRLSGRAFLDTWKMDQPVLTANQAHDLVSALNLALLELELQRAAHLARTAGCAG